MSDVERVKAEVSRGVESGDLLARLAERVGSFAQARAVFGEPVERPGLTVIPVAKAVWGFGGGSGGEGENQGAGGGGGGRVSPLGYIEVRDGSAEFKSLRRSWLGPALTAGLIGAAAALLRRAL